QVTTFDNSGRSNTSGCSSSITLLTDTPTVSVAAPTAPAVSVLGAITASNINVTCSMDGTVIVLDNTDDDVIVGATSVEAGTPETIAITGVALDSVTGSDG